MSKMDLPWDKIRGICLTHSHTDHTSKLSSVMRVCDVPVYMTREEYYQERMQKLVGKFMENPPRMVFIEPNKPFKIGSFMILPIRANHDVGLPCHFYVQDENSSFFFGCDTVDISMDAFNCMYFANFVMMESNYDEDAMNTDILDGEPVETPYDEELKYRIRNTAHMSNSRVRSVIKYLDKDKPILLGHISKTYNSKKTLKKVFRKMKNVIIVDRDEYPQEWIA